MRRWRTAVAGAAFAIGLFIYAILAVALLDLLPPLHWALEGVIYLFLGLVWIFPATSLLGWVARREEM
ncbi:MAG: DUF2842 domain-containing protein [Pseudomonadota bacterium]